MQVFVRSAPHPSHAYVMYYDDGLETKIFHQSLYRIAVNLNLQTKRTAPSEGFFSDRAHASLRLIT